MQEQEETFFKEFIGILISLNPSHPDITEHVTQLENLIQKANPTRHIKPLKPLNRTELEAILRFVQKPKGRHHIAEIEKLLKHETATQAGILFLRHFYKHEGEHLPHTEGLKHL